MQQDGSTGRAGPAVRPARGPPLARHARPRTTGSALDDLAAHLATPRARLGPRRPSPTSPPTRAAGAAPRPPRRAGREGRRPGPTPAGRARWRRSCSGPAYQLGLVRAAEEVAERAGGSSSSPPLGRYVLALGPAAAAPADVRALPVRPAELRGHRLPPGADPGADRPVQPVRPLVAGRRGAGAEAHARVGLPRPRRGPDARGDARPAGAAQPAAAARRAWPRRSGPGPAAASG